MNYNKIRKIAKEIIAQSDKDEEAKAICNRIADHLEKKAPKLFDRKPMTRGSFGWSIWFTKKYDKNMYSVSVDTEFDNRVHLNFYEEKEIKSESLADTTKNYETTSARFVKYKKRKLLKYYENGTPEQNEAKAVKAIDKWFIVKTAQRGMDEESQKMYNGVDRSIRKYDQLGIIESDRDWLDDVAVQNELENNEYQRSLPEIIEEDVERTPNRRDELQKYQPADQTPIREMYWQPRTIVR